MGDVVSFLPNMLLQGIGAGVGLFANQEAERQREEALRQRMLQNQLAANQKTEQRQRQLERVLSTQQAEIGVRGIDPASASLKAIEMDSFNEYAKDEQAQSLDLGIQQQDARSLLEQTKEQTGLSDLGDLFGFATGLYQDHEYSKLYSFYRGMPQSRSQDLPTFGDEA